ncbi:MAG TPA: thiol reductant ABC exporter subunit CydC [Solirubrobacteraceae bacterium]|nr:thiol reductant ABC exporter subunit CydC [Solirubrobacteraceae bacterium]
MRALLACARPGREDRRWLAVSVLLAAGATGAAVALLSTSGYLISRAAQRPQVIALTVTIVAVRSFGLLRAVTRYAERLASHQLTLGRLGRMRGRFFADLAERFPARTAPAQRGELLSRFVSDVDTLSELHLRVVIPLLVALLVVAGTGLAAMLMTPALGLVVAGALLADGVVTGGLSMRAGARAARRQAPVRARLTAAMIESIDAAPELAVAGHARTTVAGLESIDRELSGLGRRDAAGAAAAHSAHGLVAAAGLLAVLAVSIAAVHAHRMPGVLVAAAAFLFLGAGEAIAPLARAATHALEAAVAARRLREIAESPVLVTDPVQPRPLPPTGALVLDAVTFAYGEAEPDVLRGATLCLAPGERVALIGESGAGKSSLAELLVRFHDPAGGRVTLDGTDVRDLLQSDLRRAVVLAGQDAHLFNTTIRENLRIADRESSEEDLRCVLAAVALEDWLDGLPEGLDTRVGQDGALVSGGQRQRLALARALLSPARFLILDEPTAHLDADTAAAAIDGLLTAAGHRGLLVITHDATHRHHFDRVLELRDGRIVTAS